MAFLLQQLTSSGVYLNTDSYLCKHSSFKAQV